MRLPAAPDVSLAFRYESLVSLFLVALSLLWRGDPDLEYPGFLLSLLGLLGVNVLAGTVLRLRRVPSWAGALFVLGNCAAVTWTLSFSGGYRSTFWVLYLIPIYTVCLLLGAREVLWVSLGIAALNGAMHMVWAPEIAGEIWLSLVLKTAILMAGAFSVWRVADKERRTAAKIRRQRVRLSALADRVVKAESYLQGCERIADVGLVSGGVVHDLRNPLTVILGTTDVLLEEHPKRPDIRADLERIRRCAEHCSRILSGFMDLFHAQELSASPTDIHELVREALAVNAGALKGIQAEAVCGPGVPKLQVSRPHIERVLADLVRSAAERMPEGGKLTVRTALEGDGRWVRVAFEDTGSALPESRDAGFYLSREIAKKHGGGLAADRRPEGGVAVTLTLPVKV
ncbi:MAG: HAMP domain-containing sensor histidine kinase [Elusimicrobiota bacterium]